MMKRAMLFGLLAVTQLGLVAPAPAREAATVTRKDIRSMPILERPSRPGHFYGNSVRRNAVRKSSFTPANIWAE